VKGRGAALAAACLLLLAPAALLTTFRVSDPSWARAVQAVAFTPFAIPLYAAALVLLVAVMVVRRTATVRHALTAVVALVGLALHAAWFAPEVIGETPAPADGAERVVVMTANLLRGRADVEQLLDRVRDHEVDLLVVNEITESSLAGLEDAGVAELLPFHEGGAGADETVPGTMVFSAEPTELIDVLDTKLGSLVVDVGDIRLMAVHPMSPVWPADWRADHATVLAAVEEQEPDLVAGDFNATADHKPMRDLEEAGYRDSVELTNGGFQPTWPANGTFPLVGLLGAVAPIDHVLVSDDWTVTDSRTTQIDGTDHKPVIAVVARD
jgi:endonuclease/exonuclease/phosphatase (EEP) superfamily protein YafD